MFFSLLNFSDRLPVWRVWAFFVSMLAGQPRWYFNIGSIKSSIKQCVFIWIVASFFRSKSIKSRNFVKWVWLWLWLCLCKSLQVISSAVCGLEDQATRRLPQFSDVKSVNFKTVPDRIRISSHNSFKWNYHLFSPNSSIVDSSPVSHCWQSELSGNMRVSQ